MIINRNHLAIYCSGTGIEIGAYHNPFPICKAIAHVDYVDKWSYEKLIEMRNADPNLKPDMALAPVDIIDDGEYLVKIQDNSQDFVISSHQLEHCKSPLTAIHNHIRVCKPGAKVVYAVPDKRYTFDKDRPLTEMVTLVELYHANRSQLRPLLIPLYDDYYLHVDKITSTEERLRRADQAIIDNADVHFHVWNSETLMQMFLDWSCALRYEIELFSRAGHESFVVLRKKNSHDS